MALADGTEMAVFYFVLASDEVERTRSTTRAELAILFVACPTPCGFAGVQATRRGREWQWSHENPQIVAK
jgi:hypothetical protein